MNRRNFIGKLLVAGASFAILPGAGRIWHVRRTLKVVAGPFNPSDYAGKWHFVCDPPHVLFFSGDEPVLLDHQWADLMGWKPAAHA